MSLTQTQLKLSSLRTIMTALIALIALVALIAAARPAVTTADTAAAPVPASATAAPHIEVAFVLDTTGSMGGLIEGAKAKIWSIANQIIAAKPTPKLKIALVGYRDRGDDYVTKVFDLSEDIDTVYANLTKFQAAGGGDTPESVNQALHEAVTKLAWSSNRDVLKIIFLVGDCPPHMDYPNDILYPDVCQQAVKKDLIINTIQCGDDTSTTPVWRDIASRSEGTYVAIGQTGDMQIVTTPLDEELAKLNAELGTTLIPYGAVERQESVRAKQVMAEAAPAPAAADRLAYNRKVGKAVQGGGDLVDDSNAGAADLDTLKPEELPAELQSMTVDQRKQYIAEQTAKRAELQGKIDELLQKRQEYIDAETKRQAAEGKGSAFDSEVNTMLRSQAARKGIDYNQE